MFIKINGNTILCLRGLAFPCDLFNGNIKSLKLGSWTPIEYMIKIVAPITRFQIFRTNGFQVHDQNKNLGGSHI
jgi:uncharacterized ubiquitin-like protein YukD